MKTTKVQLTGISLIIRENAMWNPQAFMTAVHQQFPKLTKTPYTLRTLGQTTLKSPGDKGISHATFYPQISSSDPKRGYFIISEQTLFEIIPWSNPLFVIRTASNEEGFKGLHADVPVIIGAASPHIDRLKPFLPKRFPNFAFAVTYQPGGSILVENLEAAETHLSILLTSFPTLQDNEIKELAQTNATTLEEALGNITMPLPQLTLPMDTEGPTLPKRKYFALFSPTGKALEVREKRPAHFPPEVCCVTLQPETDEGPYRILSYETPHPLFALTVFHRFGFPLTFLQIINESIKQLNARTLSKKITH